MQLVEYLDENGASPFGEWFEKLPPQPAAKVVAALARMENGNLSNAKGVGSGVMEFRIDSGPGYRLYFGRDGDALIILLVGGTKRRQQRDIETAQDHWTAYKARKKGK
jgi:putative addiction module killer protein